MCKTTIHAADSLPSSIVTNGLQSESGQPSPVQTAWQNGSPALINNLGESQVVSQSAAQQVPDEVLEQRNQETVKVMEELSQKKAEEQKNTPESTAPAGEALSGSVTEKQSDGVKENQALTAAGEGKEPPLIGDELENNLRELKVPEELFRILRDFRPGLLCPVDLSLEELTGHAAQVQEQLKLLTENPDPDMAEVTTRLFMIEGQLHNSIVSRKHLDAILQQLKNIHDADTPPERKLKQYEEVAILYRVGKDQNRMIHDVAEGQPQRLQDLTGSLGTGPTIVGPDLEEMESRLSSLMGEALHEMQKESVALSPDNIRSVVKLALRSGEAPVALLESLRKGLSWVESAGYREELATVLLDGVRRTAQDDVPLTTAQQCEIMNYVDMIFQGAYPEYADEALDLKKLLLPDDGDTVALQHQCVITSRHLYNLLLEDKASSSSTRGAALDRVRQGGALSARFFLLTPKFVRSLNERISLPDLNFHLAHLVVLQKRAVDAGLFPVTPAQAKEMRDVKEWCSTLGLMPDIANYAAQVDRQLDDPEQGRSSARLLEKAGDFFVQGLSGMTGLDKARSIMKDRADMTGTFSFIRHENKILRSSADYMARLALDYHIVNLSGLIKESERFANDSDMSLNGGAVDAAIRKEVQKLYARISGTELPPDLHQHLEERQRVQREYLADLKCFADNARTMRTLAYNTNEGLVLRTQIKNDEDLLLHMQSDKGLLHMTWPHRRASRMEYGKIVLHLAALNGEYQSLPEDSPRREEVEHAINKELRKLKGVSPFTLASSSSFGTPDLDTVLKNMLPRARALSFFQQTVYSNGLPTTEYKLTLERIRQKRDDIRALQKGIDSSMDALRAQFGTDNIYQLQQTVTAAVYKVFAESRQPLTSFSLKNPLYANALKEQLLKWGLPVERGLTRQLVKITVASLTEADGYLKESVLRREADRDRLRYAGVESRKAMQEELHEAGHNLLMAWGRSHDFINRKLLSDDRRRNEGVKALMREASLPGRAFVYDRERGMVMDSGSFFLPTTRDNSHIDVLNLKHPLSLRLRLMKDDSMSVANVGDGAYQVMLKGSFAAGLGATMKLAVPDTPLMLVLGADGDAKKERGLALTFGNAADCERFLSAFMKSDSALHHQSKEQYDPSLWLSASQIRFIDGHNVSANMNASLMYTLFQQALNPLPGTAISASATVTLALAGEMARQVEQNATGESTTFSLKGRVTVAASLSEGVANQTHMVGSRHLSGKRSGTLDMEQRFRIDSGATGILASTCAESEYMVGALQRGSLHYITRALLLPEEVSEAIRKEVSFADDFEKLINGLPPTARLIVHRELRPEVLEQTRALFVKARLTADAAEKEKALEEAHRLLASLDSYRPVRLSVKRATPSQIADNWSPGLGAFQYARHTSFMRVDTRGIDIALPQDN